MTLAPKRSALMFERTDAGGLRAGEWRRGIGGELRIACPACGALDELEEPEALWACPSEACAAICWIELLPANPSAA